MHELTASTLDFIKRNGLILPDDRVLLSLSAGKDSMAMLHILREISGIVGFTMGIFHLNHCIRGGESDMDENFVRETAASMGITAHMFSHDFSAESAAGKSFEERARDIRYALLSEVSRDRGYSKIAMGHNRGDNIETILMRIFTGTGVYGLKGIPPCRDNIIRPLLNASPESIYRFLSDSRIPWREDSSNSEERYRRNFIRNRVIPLVRESFPMLADSIESLSSVAGEYESLLESRVLPQAVSGSIDDGSLCIPEKNLDSPELFGYAMSRILRERFGLSLPSSAIREMRRKLESVRGGIVLYDNGVFTVARKNVKGVRCIAVKSREIKTDDDWEYQVELAPGYPCRIFLREIGIECTITETSYDFFIENRTDGNYVFIGLSHDQYILSIRNRRNGDAMDLEFGMKKLKDLFIEKKLDSEAKKRVPLIIVGADVAAIVPGAVCAALNRVAPGYHVVKDAKKVLALYFAKKQM